MKKSNLKKIISIMSCLSFANSLSNLSLHAMNNGSAENIGLNILKNSSNKKKTNKWETDKQSFKTKDEWIAYFQGYLGQDDKLGEYVNAKKFITAQAWHAGHQASNENKSPAIAPEKFRREGWFTEGKKIKQLEAEAKQKFIMSVTGAHIDYNRQRKQMNANEELQKNMEHNKKKENSAPLDVQKEIQIKRILDGVEKDKEMSKKSNDDNLKHDKKQIEEKNNSKDFKTKNSNIVETKTKKDNSINLQKNEEKSQNKGLITDGNTNKIINKDSNKINSNPENILEKSNGMNKAIVKTNENSSKTFETKNNEKFKDTKFQNGNNIVEKVTISQNNENINENVLQNKDKQLNEKEKSLDELNKELEKRVGIKADANKSSVDEFLTMKHGTIEQKAEITLKKLNNIVKEIEQNSENKIGLKISANTQKEINKLHKEIDKAQKNKNLAAEMKANEEIGKKYSESINNKFNKVGKIDEKGDVIIKKGEEKFGSNKNRSEKINTNIEDGKLGEKSVLHGTFLDKIKDHPYLSGTAAIALALGAYKGLDYYMESNLEDKKAETAKQNAKQAKMNVLNHMAEILNNDGD